MSSKSDIRVLVVEDEQALNDAYQMILESAGYTIAVAHDGTEALEVAREFSPHVILLDLRMPRMSGIEFLRQYDLPRAHQDVQIVVFSNLDTDSEIQEAYKLGAQKYILKAWASPRELVKIIESLTEAGNDTGDNVAPA